MDTARYVVGCFLVIGLPPALAWWFVIHPFVSFWRRVGVRRTFSILTALFLLSTIPLYGVRDALLMSDLGTSWIMVGLGAVSLAASTWIALKRRKYLTTRILAGGPELEASGKGGHLLTEGPYSMSRNPRYIEAVSGIFAYSCFCNYMGTYVLALLSLPAVHLIVLFEEKELRDRFGDEYEAYVDRVPRYIPHLGGSRT